MKTLVLGIWYNEVIPYGSDYFISLKNQSNTDFDILIITDKAELPQEYITNKMIVIPAEKGSTPAEIRTHGIQFAKDKGYEVIIFTDCDDYFSENRVAKAKAGLNQADFFVNNLTLVTKDNEIIKEKLYSSSLSELTFLEVIKRNFFGLSNTAVKISSLPADFYIPRDLVAIDWWIFSLLLLNKASFTFDEDVITFYRQHSANTIGMNNSLSRQKLELGIKVKRTHYIKLLEYLSSKKISDYANLINEQLIKINELDNLLQDKNFQQTYLGTINKNYQKVNFGWWNEVLTLNDWRQYA